MKHIDVARNAVPLLLIASTLFVAVNAHANDALCKAPPYGDAQSNFDAMLAAINQAVAASPDLPPGLLKIQMLTTIEMACEAKFLGRNRAMFNKKGISGSEISITGPVALANRWFAARNAEAQQEQEPQREARPDTRIYMVFICSRIAGSCQMTAPARVALGQFMPAITYPSLSDYQDDIKRTGGGRMPDAQGRFMLGQDMWSECRGKHVDTWESGR
jgi:hypothetical protein